jgi:hypothetical protein
MLKSGSYKSLNFYAVLTDFKLLYRLSNSFVHILNIDLPFLNLISLDGAASMIGFNFSNRFLNSVFPSAVVFCKIDKSSFNYSIDMSGNYCDGSMKNC